MNEDTGTGVKDKARTAAAEGAEKAQEIVGVGAGKAQDKVAEQVDRNAARVGGQIRSLGEALSDTSQRLRSDGNDAPAQAAERIGAQVQRLGDRISQSSGDELLHEVDTFIRRQPAAAAAIAFAAGLVAARVIKASGESRTASRYPMVEAGGGYASSTPSWDEPAPAMRTSELTGARNG